MRTANRDIFTTIHSEGSLLPVDLLQRVSSGDIGLDFLTPQSYHLAPSEKINEAVNRSWNRLTGLWQSFQEARGKLPENDLGTTLTRERWLLPLFDELGYGRLAVSKADVIAGKSYPISHRWQEVPIHLVGCGLSVDRRTPGAAGAARVSPHSLMQEYLNRNPEVQWGIVSNGLVLRVMRDNASLTRQAFLEFDLLAMFAGEAYSDFVLLWLVCHQSRLEKLEKDGECVLERWSQAAMESGTRALDNLRNGVKQSIEHLGQGFLAQANNRDLREKLRNRKLSAQGYYRQLLRLVYRLIFLFTAEDRDLLMLPEATSEERARYQEYYSTSRLRRLAERQRGTRHHDRYEALKLVSRLLGTPEGCPELALPVLDGLLFSPGATPDLDQAVIDNRAFLDAIRALAFITEGRTRRTVDYRNLGPDELGSVYESLLELHPRFSLESGAFELSEAAGSERKTTGSHYTRPDLVNELIASALDPVIEEKLKGAKEVADQEQALLSLTVCDPACGSGHFLVAAAHRIAGRLAEVRAGGAEPSPQETRAALREVIRHCIYGVDINPMAVELCKVNLWLEALEPGKPLAFLNAHIRCGNSLIGIGPNTDVSILPDEAFNAVSGDDKVTANYLKRRNKRERSGEVGLLPTVFTPPAIEGEENLSEEFRLIKELPEDTFIQTKSKQDRFSQIASSKFYKHTKQISDLWTSAFFWHIKAMENEADVFAPTQTIITNAITRKPIHVNIDGPVAVMSHTCHYFHWKLEFPDIFLNNDIKDLGDRPGFDCVLGNPPWEMMQLEEEQFFAIRDPEIASLPGDQRKRAIKVLKETNPDLFYSFQSAKHYAEAQNKFLRSSDRFPLTARGKMNSYALFAELCCQLVSKVGRVGIIVPTGIATDDGTKDFFGDLVEKKAIASLFDFENREALFTGSHRSYKFCLLTLSNTPIQDTQFVFFATRVEHLRDPRRRFTLKPEDIALFNANTRTMPVFRTRQDAELARAIYERVPVLINERTGENHWGVSFKQGLFNMTSDSHLFVTEPRPNNIPLYEAKMIEQFDHRFGTFDQVENRNSTHLPNPDFDFKKNPWFSVKPWYWVPLSNVDERKSSSDITSKYLFGYRFSTGPTNSRTMIASIIPDTSTNHVLPLIYTNDILKDCFLLALLNSIVYDYFLRQKMGRQGLDLFFVKQSCVVQLQKENAFVISKVLELVFTAWDIKGFAEELEYSGDPFLWDEDRRALLRAELDAYYARLYGLNRKQLRYILDPADLTEGELEDILDPHEEVADPLDPQGYTDRQMASDFPGETFRVLKDKEMREFGEYRTRRLVLEAWERLKDVEIGDQRTG